MEDERMQGMLADLGDGRTDRVFDLLAAGAGANLRDGSGVSLIQHCAYFGDVSAIRWLMERGASLTELGDDLGLIGASFHGHWRLCAFLLEHGADPNVAPGDTGETPLHAALCTTDRVAHDRVLRVLLNAGADPNRATVPGKETGGFMRDCRTKGETPLHRAAAFGEAGTIQMLLDAGAVIDAKDANGETPLSWGSWHVRPTPILRLLLYGNFRIRAENRSMRENLLGDPPKG